VEGDMKLELKHDQNYIKWMSDIKARVRQAQLKAAVKVNTELLMFYWDLGADIVAKQTHAKWGDGFLLQLSKDLMSAFPDMKGFSKRNLELIRQWYLFYSKGTLGQHPAVPIAKQPVSQLAAEISQQPVGQIGQQITNIPWGHNIAIINKCKNIKEALFYVQNTLKHNWSRAVLVQANRCFRIPVNAVFAKEV
jgi:predicted nuclease of restriction endonuclease-like (RecB) superfamily